MKLSSRPLAMVLIALAAAFGLAGCGYLPTATPTSSICNGVSTDIGPCGGGPTFTATTCEGLATEFGAALDKAVLEVVRGPADVGGEAKSVRIKHAEVFVTTALTDRMIAQGLLEQCTMPAFLDAAKAGISDELKSTIGHAMFDGSPDVTYDDFLADLAKVMSGIGKRP